MTTDFENETSNEFTEPETGVPDEPLRKPGAAAHLAEAWQTRPLLKFMVLIIGVFAVGAAAVKFFSDEGPVNAGRRGRSPRRRRLGALRERHQRRLLDEGVHVEEGHGALQPHGLVRHAAGGRGELL